MNYEDNWWFCSENKSDDEERESAKMVKKLLERFHNLPEEEKEKIRAAGLKKQKEVAQRNIDAIGNYLKSSL